MLKKILLGVATAATLGGSTAVLAGGNDINSAVDNSGVYLRGQLGYGFNHNGLINDLTGRVALGYSFNQYFGLEAGYQPFRYAYAIDLLAKATLPIHNFFAFVEGGVAYVNASSFLATWQGFGFLFAPSQHRINAADPKLGLGLGYNFSQHLALDVSYDYLFNTYSRSQNLNFPGFPLLNATVKGPNIETAMVGLTYKF